MKLNIKHIRLIAFDSQKVILLHCLYSGRYKDKRYKLWDNFNMRTLIFILWLLVLIITGSLTAISLDNPIRMIVPVIGLLGVSVIEHLSQIKFEKKIAVFVRRIFAIPFLVLGFNWISIFILTTYRSHHRPVIIPLAIIFLIIGLALTHYKIYSKEL